MLQVSQSVSALATIAYPQIVSVPKSQANANYITAVTAHIGGKAGATAFSSEKVTLLYIIKGLPVAKLKARTKHLLSESQFLFLAPNTSVQLDSQTRNSVEILIIEIPLKVVQDFLVAQECLNKALFLTIKTGELIPDMVIKSDEKLAKSVLDLCSLPPQIQTKEIDVLLTKLFCGRTRFFFMGLYQKQTSTFTLEYITKFIQENIATNFRIDELAGMACMSKPHFFRRFKEVFGISPVCYIHQEKIAVAKNLLLKNYTVNETAHCLGFGSTNYFIRVFKQIEHKTPMAFKCCELPLKIA